MTYQCVDIQDSGISLDGLVEYAKCLIVAHVDKVLSFNYDLSVSVVRTTSWLNLFYFGIVIVPVLKWA